MKFVLGVLWEDFFEICFCFGYVWVVGEVLLGGEMMNVSVDGEGRYVKVLRYYDGCSFVFNVGKCF